MGWADVYKQKFPKAGRAKSSLVRKVSAKKTPADRVVEYLENSLKFRADKNFKIEKRGGGMVAPELCYEEKGGKWFIHAKYGRAMLEFDDEGNKFLIHPENEVEDVIKLIIEGLKNGEFNDRLTKLQENRKKGNGD